MYIRAIDETAAEIAKAAFKLNLQAVQDANGQRMLRKRVFDHNVSKAVFHEPSNFKVDSWTDRNSGEERSKPVVRVDRLELLGSKRDAEAAGGFNAGGGPGTNPSDEEVPF